MAGEGLTFVELGHIHVAMVEVKRGLQGRQQLPEQSRVLQQGGAGGLEGGGRMHRGAGGGGGRN